MITEADIGRRVVVAASGEFYQFIDGWRGTLEKFVNGQCEVHVPSEEVTSGHLTFLIPPEQLRLTV